MQEYNVALPIEIGKYARIFDTRLQMGQPYQIEVQSSEWLLPKKDIVKIEVNEAIEANQVFQLTSDKTIGEAIFYFKFLAAGWVAAALEETFHLLTLISKLNLKI